MWGGGGGGGGGGAGAVVYKKQGAVEISFDEFKKYVLGKPITLKTEKQDTKYLVKLFKKLKIK